jgi:hypothetical protein
MFNKTKSFFSLLLALVLAAGVVVTPAFAIDAEALCDDQGGTWDGADAFNGQCTYLTDAPDFYSWCEPADTYMIETYVAGSITTGICYNDTPPGGSPSSDSDSEEIGPQNTNPTNEGGAGGTLTLGAGKNGSATFPEGTCGQKCSISSSLPAGASSSLPANAIATLYVRVVDEGGQPGSGSYTVCFANPDGAVLTIYRYVGGAWVALQIANTSPVCVNASGDGAFYLG